MDAAEYDKDEGYHGRWNKIEGDGVGEDKDADSEYGSDFLYSIEVGFGDDEKQKEKNLQSNQNILFVHHLHGENQGWCYEVHDEYVVIAGCIFGITIFTPLFEKSFG